MKNTANLSLRTKLCTQRKRYKTLIRNKKSCYYNSSIDEIALNSRQPRMFWKKLKILKKSDTREANFSESTIIKHFSSLLCTDRIQKPVLENSTNCDLDTDITLEEVNSALKKSKNNKSAGLDVISKEMVHAFTEIYPNFLPKLFNIILKSKHFPEEWLTALIVLIHKKGTKSDISNYRGISLLSCLSKLFCSVLNNRIVKWGEENNVFSTSQLGFRKGNRTSDALTILHNLVDKYCHKGKSPLYACFVDFQKAFDKIPRDLLLQKLNNIGVRGNVYDIIKSMYTGDNARIKIDDKMTKLININQGVRQGCVLSPTLFNFFLSDFEKFISDDSETNPISINNVCKVPCIIWADDIVLLSETKSGLQKQIDKLSNYSATNMLPVNIEKTKCMCFNKSGKLIRNCFFFEENALEDVSDMMYLGFLVRCNGSINAGLKNLGERALKAFYKIKESIGYSFYRNAHVAFKIFDSIIKPILLYASDFWGLYKLSVKGRSPCDIIHIKFCKWFLGVSKHTTTQGVLYELGRYPISFEAQTRHIDNWIRIIGVKICNPLLLQSCLHAVNEGLPFSNNLTEYLTQIDLPFLIEHCDKIKPKSKVTRNIRNYLKKDFIIKLDHTMSSIKSKVSLLKVIKPNIGMAPYISISNFASRKIIAKFRLSDHPLEIERGRYMKIPRSKRLCKICHGGVEDIEHFSLACNELKEIRLPFIVTIQKIFPNFSNLNNQDKIILLLNPNIDTINLIYTFFLDLLDLRDVKLKYRACSNLILQL